MIKVLIPSMPAADEVLPFLREMDDTQIYVNTGPLVRRLERELEAVIVGNPCRVVANGTMSLQLALEALGLPPGAKVLVPAVTYVASGQAIVNAGLVPVLGDIRRDDMLLHPHDAAVAIARLDISAVMPVATFGEPVPIEPWEKFARVTQLPVVIDAAGSILDQKPSAWDRVVISYSLHATKALGAGEGGVVASRNEQLLDRVESLANFGPGGTNAKMSEYHAAVGLASIQRLKRPTNGLWCDRLEFTYLPRLLRIDGIELHAAVDLTVRTLLPVLLPDHCDAAAVSSALAAVGIETKQWYRPFLNERPEFFRYQRDGLLPVTGILSKRMLGLPWHEFLTDADVALICGELRKAIA